MMMTMIANYEFSDPSARREALRGATHTRRPRPNFWSRYLSLRLSMYCPQPVTGSWWYTSSNS